MSTQQDIDIDQLFSTSTVTTIPNAVDALLEEIEPTQPTHVNTEKTDPDNTANVVVPIPRRSRKLPPWFMPLPQQGFKYVTKQQITQVLREKCNLLQKHVALNDTYYFSQWTAATRRRVFGSNMTQYARLHLHRKTVAPTNNDDTIEAAESDKITIGLDAIQAHLDQREKEAEHEASATKIMPNATNIKLAKIADKKSLDGSLVEDNLDSNADLASSEVNTEEKKAANKKVALLGRFVHNSVKSARGVARWSKEDDSTSVEQDSEQLLKAMPELELFPERKFAAFDYNRRAVARRFVETGFEFLIKAQDDLIALQSLPLVDNLTCDEFATKKYFVKLDTQDVVMNDVITITHALQDEQNALQKSIVVDDEENALPKPTRTVRSPAHANIVERQELNAYQLATIRTRLQDSLNSFLDQFMELLDLEYTLIHVSDTLNQLHLYGMGQSVEALCLAQCMELASQFQLPLNSPLSAVIPHLPPPAAQLLDIKHIAAILDASPYTVFSGVDYHMVKFLLLAPRTRLALAKGLNIALEAKSAHSSRLLGVLMELLPDLMCIDKNILHYYCGGPQPQPLVDENGNIVQIVPAAILDESLRTDTNDVINQYIETNDIPSALYRSRYIHYLDTNDKPVTITSTSPLSSSDASTRQQLGSVMALAIQTAPHTIIQRSCRQFNQFFSNIMKTPQAHFMWDQTVQVELEQFGLFSALLRNILFGSIYHAFLYTMDNSLAVSIPALEHQLASLQQRLSAETRFKDIFVAYGRSIQVFLRSLNAKLSDAGNKEEILKISYHIPPTDEHVATLVASSTPISATMDCSALFQTETLGELFEKQKDKYQYKDNVAANAQAIQEMLSALVYDVFALRKMKERKSVIDQLTAETMALGSTLTTQKATNFQILNEIVNLSIIPLSLLFSNNPHQQQPVQPEAGPVDKKADSPEKDMSQDCTDNSNNTQDPVSDVHNTTLTTPPDNLLWWIFLGVKPYDETCMMQSSITQKVMDLYGYKSNGLLSLWNKLFSTNPVALKTLHERNLVSAARYDTMYTHILRRYNQPLENKSANRYLYSKVGRSLNNNNRPIDRRALKKLEACQTKYREMITTAVDFHRNSLAQHDHSVNQIRHDYTTPLIAGLPQKLSNFIAFLKQNNSITKHVYANSQHTTNLELMVSTLLLLSIHLAEPFKTWIVPHITPILHMWLHIQKDIYINLVQSHPIDSIPSFQEFITQLPYIHYLQAIVPPSEFIRVYQQVDAVVQIYDFIARDTAQFREHCRQRFDEFQQIIEEMRNEEQQPKFPPLGGYQPIPQYQSNQSQPPRQNYSNNRNNNNSNDAYQHRPHNRQDYSHHTQTVSAQPVSAQPVSAQPVSAQPVSAQPVKKTGWNKLPQ